MSKRGRKKKEEYYTLKKMDNVKISENSYTIYLPINIEKCLVDINIKSQIDIISQNTSINGYNNNLINYSKIEETKHIMEKTSEIIEENKDLKTYDISLSKDKITKTSLHCWWCCHQFENEPIAMPEKLIKDKYWIKGIFCSYSCCYSYMKDNNKATWLLNYMFRDTTNLKGIMKDYIKPAPPRESLKIFGGPLSIEDFRSTDNTFVISDFPMTYIPRVLNEVIKNENKNKKETPTNRNSLAKFLNL